jgi:hypothetical protein
MSSTFSIQGLPLTPAQKHHDEYEMERTVAIDTRVEKPINETYEQQVKDERHWDRKNPEHNNKFIMLRYVCNMVEKALCLLKNNEYRYSLKLLGMGVYGCTFRLKYNGIQRAVKFQIYNEQFLLEQKTMLKFQQIKPEIAVKMDKYCYVWFPQQRFYVAIMQMDLIDGTLDSLLLDPNISEDLVEDLGEQIFLILKIMRVNHLNHADMHLGNIAYRILPNNTYKVLLIDFGWGSHSKYIPSINELSFLRGILMVLPDESLMLQLVLDSLERFISEKDIELISEGQHGISQDKVDDLYHERLYKEYSQYKKRLTEQTFRKQIAKTSKTSLGEPGPLNEFLGINTRSKHTQFSCPNGECSPDSPTGPTGPTQTQLPSTEYVPRPYEGIPQHQQPVQEFVPRPYGSNSKQHTLKGQAFRPYGSPHKKQPINVIKATPPTRAAPTTTNLPIPRPTKDVVNTPSPPTSE